MTAADNHLDNRKHNCVEIKPDKLRIIDKGATRVLADHYRKP